MLVPDIFAFGVVLYEMVTGTKAFEGKTQAGLMSAILRTEPPPISAHQALAQPALDHLVRRCLAKDPDDRWQTMRDLKEELRWIATDGSMSRTAQVNTVAKPGRETLAWAAAGVLALALAAALSLVNFAWRHSRQTRFGSPSDRRNTRRLEQR